MHNGISYYNTNNCNYNDNNNYYYFSRPSSIEQLVSCREHLLLIVGYPTSNLLFQSGGEPPLYLVPQNDGTPQHLQVEGCRKWGGFLSLLLGDQSMWFNLNQSRPSNPQPGTWKLSLSNRKGWFQIAVGVGLAALLLPISPSLPTGLLLIMLAS